MRLAILGNPDGWYARDLMRASGDGPIDVLSFRSLVVAPDAQQRYRVLASLADQESEPRVLAGPGAQYDAVLVRSMPLGSLEQIIFRMNALHVATRLGLRCVNPPRCLEVAIDKWLTLETLRPLGIETPRTSCCQTRDSALRAWESLGRDCVIKPIFGGEGRGLMRVSDPDLAWRVFGTLEQLQSVLYVQEFLPSQGFDIRLLVIGQEIFAVRRYAQGDWRTNLARGGYAVPHEATQRQCEIARLAARQLGSVVMGVDILPTQDGRDVLIEVNAVPGWRGTAQALQVDIAQRVLAALQRTAAVVRW
jgi:ribosomal protein S6--L-glutamate ligase